MFDRSRFRLNRPIRTGSRGTARISSTATAEIQQIARLRAAGARYIMVFNIPDLGATPQSLAGGAAAIQAGTAASVGGMKTYRNSPPPSLRISATIAVVGASGVSSISAGFSSSVPSSPLAASGSPSGVGRAGRRAPDAGADEHLLREAHRDGGLDGAGLQR